MNNKLKIGVIDSVNGRFNKLRETLSKVKNLSISRLGIDWRTPTYTNVEKIDIFLLHISDQQRRTNPCNDFLNYLASKIPNAIVVLYSGGGLQEERGDRFINIRLDSKIWHINLPKGAISNFCIIHQAVDEHSVDNLNLEFALESYLKNQDKEELFNILRGEKTEFISALFILCQGYLATNSNSNDPAVVQEALDKMGWNEFRISSDHAKIICKDLSKKKTDTQETSWWLDRFAPMTIDEIHDQIVKEWNEIKYGKVCSCINELIDALKKTPPIEDTTIVANAYLAIRLRLTQKYS